MDLNVKTGGREMGGCVKRGRRGEDMGARGKRYERDEGG